MPRRRNTRRPRRRRRKTLAIGRAPMPTRFATKLRYNGRFSLSPGAVADAIPTGASHVFSANGMYDPDISATGHQPRGYDQLMTMYDHYTVVGAKITVTLVNTNTTASGLVPFLLLMDNNVKLGTLDDMMEQGRVKSRILGASDGSRATSTLSKGYSTKKFFSRSDIMDNADLKGSEFANPIEGAFFHVGVSPLGTTTSSTVQGIVVIDYIAIFSEPKQPAKS